MIIMSLPKVLADSAIAIRTHSQNQNTCNNLLDVGNQLTSFGV